MIDEKLLQQRLTAAAAEQDDLLPRALDDDLSAGRRRLRRRRQLIAGSGLTATAATVAVVSIGVSSWLSPNAGPLPDKGPVAGQSATTAGTSKSATIPSDPDATRDWPIPAGQEPPVPAQDAKFNQNLTAAIYEHLDPGKKHLDFSSGGFSIDRQLGTIFSGGNRIGWRMPGQKGAEGYVALGVQPKTRTPRPCGSTSEPRLTCHSVKLPNGRTAQLGRKGDAADVLYQQPDGEWVDASVSTLFGNNTEIPVHDMGITDQMLLNLVQDDRLNLPTKAEDAAAPRDKPTKQAVHAVVARTFLGGKLSENFWDELPESQHYQLAWRKAGVSASVTYFSQLRAEVDCHLDLNIAKCTPVTAPGGQKVMYGEGVETHQGKKSYVVGGSYVQPDGDSVEFVVSYPGTKPPTDRPTKEQIVTALTDPTLDK